MKQDKNKIIILSLIVIVTLLLGIIGYTFFISPAVNGLVVQGQNQGIQYTIYSIAQRAATCQQVPLQVENQTINLIAVECLQQAQK